MCIYISKKKKKKKGEQTMQGTSVKILMASSTDLVFITYKAASCKTHIYTYFQDHKMITPKITQKNTLQNFIHINFQEKIEEEKQNKLMINKLSSLLLPSGFDPF